MDNDMISRSALVRVVRQRKQAINSYVNNGFLIGFVNALSIVEGQIADAPAVDATPVVRCKDCDYFNKKAGCVGFCVCGEVTGGKPMGRTGNDFCSYGTCGKNLHYVHGKKCSNCAHDGWDMPQCRECQPENGFKWYKAKAGE